MSRYSKSYGRSKNHGGAGLKFDTLLKACSNSKKPSANKTAGALGRFGIASFTSTRNVSGEEESRFKFFNKRPKLSEPSVNTPLSNTYHGNNSQNEAVQPSPYGIVPVVAAVYKPRKFFKSRDPMAAAEAPAAKEPMSPVVNPARPAVIAPIKIPIPRPKQSGKSGDSPEKNSKPLRNANNASPPQPIKLRIFKDKATSKLVSVSEAPPPTVVIPTEHSVPRSKSEKSPKKRGRKGKANAAESPVIIEEVLPAKKPGRLTRNSRKHKQSGEEPTPELPPSDPHHTINPAYPYNPPAVNELGHHFEDVSAQHPCPANAFGSSSDTSVDSSRTHPVQPPVSNVNIEKKLEEDVEFQQLSQMLSSMEEEGEGDYNNLASYHQSSHQPEPYVEPTQLLMPEQQREQQQQQLQHPHPPHQAQPMQPAHVHQFTQQQEHESPQLHPVPVQYSSSTSESFSEFSPNSVANIPVPVSRSLVNNSIVNILVTSPVPPPLAVAPPKIRDAQDIRAILEDDWDESFDEESPKKSPPKTSRFDPSAFMHDGSQGVPESPADQSFTLGHSSMGNEYGTTLPPTEEAVSIPHGRTTLFAHHQYQQQSLLNYPNPYLEAHPPPPQEQEQQQQQQQHHHHHHHHQQQHQQQQPLATPFNAPYAVRNLLSSTKEFQSQSQMNSTCSDNGQEVEFPSPPHFPSPLKDSGRELVKENHLFESDSKPAAAAAVALNLSVTPEDHSFPAHHSNTQSLQTGTNAMTATTTSTGGATKKGSIFKSRALTQSSGDAGEKGSQGNPKKRLALYKHKFGQGDGDEDNRGGADPLRSGAAAGSFPDEFDEDSDAEDLGSLRRVGTSEMGGEGYKVMCKKTTKKLYSVIRNVKPIHELQESGEFHEFDGDVWYILDELKDKNPLTNRCLSAITLATRCMEPAFRMHLRAHGTVAEFCKELHDAPTNPILALLASTVLFVLSQDRLNMDLDTDSLKLIIALTKAGEATNLADDSPEISKLRQRVFDLVSEMKSRGHAKHLKEEKITASELALETLLYLTSKRAGEWVKHELRTLGGLDYIVTEVVTSLDWLTYELSVVGFSEGVIERLWKIDRCLRVLQQVTFNHEENQRYLLGVADGKVAAAAAASDVELRGTPEIFITLFRFCNDRLAALPLQDSEPSRVLREILFSVLRVLVNLSHDYRGIVLGSEILCAMEGFLPLCLHSVFHMSMYIPDEKVFDLLMHSLCMLLNLVEYSRANRNAILASSVRRARVASLPSNTSSSWSSDDSGVEEEQQPTLDALVQMFVSKELAAKQEEASTDDILTKGSDSQKSNQKSASSAQNSQNSQNSQESESSNSVQDTIDKLIQTAGKHMENSLIAAYVSLLLAYLIMDEPTAAATVRNSMPNQRYLPLMIVLKKLFNFMSITSSASGSLRGLKATAIALKFYAVSDPESNEELKKIIPD